MEESSALGTGLRRKSPVGFDFLKPRLGNAEQGPDISHPAVTPIAAPSSCLKASNAAFEHRVFHALFATEDQKEGMDAFVNKRPPVFKHRQWARVSALHHS